MAITSLSASFTFLAFVFIEMKFAKEPFAPKRIIVIMCKLFRQFLRTRFRILVDIYIPLFFQAVKGKSASETGFSMWLELLLGLCLVV